MVLLGGVFKRSREMHKILPRMDEWSVSEGVVEKSPALLPKARSASDLEGGQQ
jgi:hypothetical protein